MLYVCSLYGISDYSVAYLNNTLVLILLKIVTCFRTVAYKRVAYKRVDYKRVAYKKRVLPQYSIERT